MRLPSAREASIPRINPRWVGLLCALCAMLLGFTALGSSGARQTDQQLRALRDGLHPRAASGEIVLVEIDAASLASIARWPWPRSVYAQAIDRLRIAGAKSIAFDVDFSSPSSRLEDTALAAALRRAQGAVALPTFVQSRRLDDARAIENVPIAPLREHAFLAAVNVYPDPDGVVRDYPYGIRLGGLARPSLAALVAERDGAIAHSFMIDQAIDPSTIPRISFADLVEGRVRLNTINAKRIIVGATAIEIGDRYAIPGRGVVPGALIQAQAAETLFQGRAMVDLGPLPALLAAAVVLLAMFRTSRLRGQLTLAAVGIALTNLVPLALEATGVATLAVGPAQVTFGAAVMIAVAMRLACAFDSARLIDRNTGLGNIAALQTALRNAPRRIIGVARITRTAELASLLGAENFAGLVQRVADRISYAAQGGHVYRVEEGALAWFADDHDDTRLSDTMEALAALLKSPVIVGGRSVDVRAVFGAVRETEGDAHSAVLKALFAADAAAADGDCWRMHGGHLAARADWNVALLGEFADALSAGQIWVAYQPKHDLRLGIVTGAEALVRWSHPLRGELSPDRFVPVIEADGDILALTLFVLRQAIRAQREWAIDGSNLGIAINVSTALLRDEAFADRIDMVVREEHADAARITLEVTESAAMADQERSIAALDRIRALGVRLSIDDYGTGQSTLTYLRRVPANEIKIDKSFVTGMLHNRSDEILVRSTIDLAHDLGFTVVAEGVENLEVMERLRTLGCDMVQGWHVGKPVDAHEFARVIAAPKSLAA